MMILPNIDELKSLFSFKEVSVGDYIYDLQIRSDITEEAEKQVLELSGLIMDFIVEITPRVIGSQATSKILTVSTFTRDLLSGSDDHYKWMYKWADFLAQLLSAMEDSMEFFAQKQSCLIKTIQFLVNEGVREGDFGQYKLQESFGYDNWRQSIEIQRLLKRLLRFSLEKNMVVNDSILDQQILVQLSEGTEQQTVEMVALFDAEFGDSPGYLLRTKAPILLSAVLKKHPSNGMKLDQAELKTLTKLDKKNKFILEPYQVVESKSMIIFRDSIKRFNLEGVLDYQRQVNRNSFCPFGAEGLQENCGNPKCKVSRFVGCSLAGNTIDGGHLRLGPNAQASLCINVSAVIRFLSHILETCEYDADKEVMTYASTGNAGWGSGGSPRNELSSLSGLEGGVWLNIVVGVGSNNYTNLYTPLSRSVWMYLSSKIGFQLAAGKDKGIVKLNVYDMMIDVQKTAELRNLGACLLNHIGVKYPGYGVYSPALAYRDFNVTLTESEMVNRQTEDLLAGAACISTWISRELSVFRNRGGATVATLNVAANDMHKLVLRRLKLSNEGKIQNFMLDQGLHEADPALHREWGVLMQSFDPMVTRLSECYPCVEEFCRLGRDCELNKRAISRLEPQYNIPLRNMFFLQKGLEFQFTDNPKLKMKFQNTNEKLISLAYQSCNKTGMSVLAGFTPGLSKDKFNRFYYNLQGCELAVPNLDFYNKDELEIRGSVDEARRYEIMAAYYMAPVFKFTFTCGDTDIPYVFSYEYELANCFNMEAWKLYPAPIQKIANRAMVKRMMRRA